MNEFNEQLLNEYLDGTLDETQQREVTQLLNESAAARAFLADLQMTFIALEELAELPLTADLSAAVVAEIESSAAPVWWTRWLMMIQISAAGFLLIQLWPSLQLLITNGTIVIAAAFAEFNWPPFSIGSQLSLWGTAVREQFQTGIPSLELASSQWSLLIVLAFVAWIAGNRLLFSEN